MSFRISSINLPYLRSQSSAFLDNTSIGVKVICVLVGLSYFLSFSESAVESLCVIPGYFLPPKFCIWTALTHPFLEVHFWEVILDVLILLFIGKLVEPLWGSREMLIFFTVVNVGVAIVSAFFYYFLYMVTFNDILLFNVRIHGLSGYFAGASVAVKQVMPDHVLYRSPIGKVTNRNVPLTVFLSTFIFWAIGLVEGSYCTMFGSGILVSWIYLRFYQVHSNGSRGDMAESFGFPGFFPNVLQPPLALVCNALFSILVRVKVCKKPVRKYDVGSVNAISLSLPGVESHDTERRRQIALKALSERLNKSDNNSETDGATAWPQIHTGELAKQQPENSVIETIPEETASTDEVRISMEHSSEETTNPPSEKGSVDTKEDPEK